MEYAETRRRNCAIATEIVYLIKKKRPLKNIFSLETINPLQKYDIGTDTHVPIITLQKLPYSSWYAYAM